MSSRFIDNVICSETLLEQYTPLHLAAHYNPHNVHEVAVDESSQQRVEEDGGGRGRSGTVESDGASIAVLRKQLSCEETIKFITDKDGVDVSLILQALHCTRAVYNFPHYIIACTRRCTPSAWRTRLRVKSTLTEKKNVTSNGASNWGRFFFCYGTNIKVKQ